MKASRSEYQLDWWLEKHGIISVSQFNFRKINSHNLFQVSVRHGQYRLFYTDCKVMRD